MTGLDRVDGAVTALRAGRLVVVVDDADREGEADLVGAAEHATAEQLAFVVRHTTGIVCVPMPAERCTELRLPQMVENGTDPHGTAFTVSVDHVGTGTGVSAADRARTVRALADPATSPADLRRPGHVFPLCARDGGVLRRRGHTEAAVDLLDLAGLAPVGVIAELVAPDGSMLAGAGVAEFAATHGLPVVSVAELAEHRRRTARMVERTGAADLPTSFGTFRAVSFRNTVDATDHLALVMGDVTAASAAARGVLTRVHSECLTGDILGSLRCDCGVQLAQAASLIAVEGCGVIVYLRGHEGRGIGLTHKIRAYGLQDGGLDTVEANTGQGLPVDARSYEVGAQILADLGVSRARVISGNPHKADDLRACGIDIIGRVGTRSMVTPHNVRYLETKRDRMGHDLDIRMG
jgi:3,4-dihydroxy 2-butanone 4-phosphate synthase/GTP cyclohydrolase II